MPFMGLTESLITEDETIVGDIDSQADWDVDDDWW